MVEGVGRSQGRGPWKGFPARVPHTHGGDEAVVAVLLCVEDPVFDENRDGPQHERHEQVHVDEIARAVQLPKPAGRGKKRP